MSEPESAGDPEHAIATEADPATGIASETELSRAADACSTNAETPDPGAAALARYRATTRRQRTWYFGIVAVIVAGLGVFVAVAWSRGEVAHTTLHIVDTPPPTLALHNPTPTLQLAWRSTDQLAIGSPLYGGTVITYSERTVGGRDAHTGKRTWSYTRTDRVVCTAAQLGGTTIAVYRVNGNCDEVSAFASDTGERRWTRTLDMDGMPLNGRPVYQWTPFTLMITSPSVIYAIDPVSGYNRWTYSRTGCRIGRAVLGSGGALVSQNCSHPDCAAQKFCGPGVQLFLRDPSAGRSDDSKTNPDQIKWNHLGDTRLPAAAGIVIAAVDRSTRTIDTFTASGGPAGSVSLTPASAPLTDITNADATDGQLIWVGGSTYALGTGVDPTLWITDTVSAPTIVSTTDQDAPSLPTARISAAARDGIEILDGNDGRVLQRFAVPAPGAGSVVTPVGTGFFVSDPNGIVTYR